MPSDRDALGEARAILRACTHVVWHDTSFSAGGDALANAACWSCCDKALATLAQRGEGATAKATPGDLPALPTWCEEYHPQPCPDPRCKEAP